MLDYLDLYTKLGRCVCWTNIWVADQYTLVLQPTDGEADDVQRHYDDRRDLVANFQNQMQGQASTMAGWAQTTKQVSDATISSLQLDLNAPNTNPQQMLVLLSAQMARDSQTIQKNTVAISSVTAQAGNYGNGLLLVSTTDAFGNPDQRIIDQTAKVTCTTDQWSNGTAGAETFQIVGWPLPSNPYVYQTQGNGTGPTFTVADASNMIVNGDFENWTVTNTPDNWTIVAGVVGTTIFKESTLVHTGTGALKLAGNGVATTVTLTQDVSTDIKGTVCYIGSVWIRKNGTVTAGSTLTIQVVGTGITKTLYSADPTALTTSYVNYPLFFATIEEIPDDLVVKITWTAANAAGATAVILIDDYVVNTPTVYGHAQYAAVRGSTDFARLDAFTVITTNDNLGVFQTYFGRFYDVFLNSGNSPTISDYLAGAPPVS